MRRLTYKVCCYVWLITALPLQAQVPAEFDDLYDTLETDLANFTARLDKEWNGDQSPLQFAAVLVPATNAGNGVAGTNANYLALTVLPYLDGLQALGVKTVKFSINFPVLYEPFYSATNGANNPDAYRQTLSFYTQLAAEIRRRGLKLIIPSQNVFPFEFAVTNYYASLTLTQYVAGRSAVLQTIARELRPDYLIVQSEPSSEVGNLPASLGAQLDDPVATTNLIAGFLSDLQAAGLRSTNLVVGAGFGTWQPRFYAYLTNYVNVTGLDLLDAHVYPINRITNNNGVSEDYLERLLLMADVAHAKGMKVGLGECWLSKVRDSELGQSLGEQIVEGRNTFSFWSPLDREFLLCMVKAGYWKQFEFIDPFWTYFFFAYLDYNQMQSFLLNLTPEQAANFLNTLNKRTVVAAMAAHQQTDTGNAYAAYLQGGPPMIQATPNNLGWITLHWTPVAVKFQLEESSDLLAPTWTPVAMPSRASGSDYTRSVLTLRQRAFYRLRKP